MRLDWNRLTQASCLLVAAWGTVVLSGCCGGGKPAFTCAAAFELNGGKYSARGDGSTKAEADRSATEGACIDYCQRGDPSVDVAWKAYKATPAGQKSTTTKSFDVDLEPTIVPIFKACTTQCSSNIASKKIVVTTTCEG